MQDPNVSRIAKQKECERQEELRQLLHRVVTQQVHGTMDRVRAAGFWRVQLPELAAKGEIDILAGALTDVLTMSAPSACETVRKTHCCCRQ